MLCEACRGQIICYFYCFGTHQIVTIFPGLKLMSFNWATNIITTGLFNAEPSILTVAPSGNINRLMRGSTPLFSSTHRIVVGRVAALQKRNTKKKLRKNIHIRKEWKRGIADCQLKHSIYYLTISLNGLKPCPQCFCFFKL